MGEKTSRYRKLLLLVGLPLALLVVAPVLPLPEATQPPHFFDVPAVKKSNKPLEPK